MEISFHTSLHVIPLRPVFGSSPSRSLNPRQPHLTPDQIKGSKNFLPQQCDSEGSRKFLLESGENTSVGRHFSLFSASDGHNKLRSGS
jgi:hypothetical protein